MDMNNLNNLNNIDCKVIQDLIPLVKDDIASEESKLLVLEHCEKCSVCKLDKEDLHMENRVQIENDNNIIKNIKKQIVFSKTLFIGIGILLASMVWGVILVNPGLAYVLLTFLFVMPITSFVITLILSIKDLWWKWIFPAVSGAIGTLTFFLWFGEMEGFSLIFIVSIFPAVGGLIIGEFVRFIRRKIKKNQQTQQTQTEETLQEKTNIKNNTKAILTAVVCVAAFSATSIGYNVFVSNNRPNFEERVREYLEYQGYYEEEIESVWAYHSPWNLFLSGPEWAVDVVFTDEPNVVYHYSICDKGMLEQQTFSGADNADELKNLDRHLWRDPNRSTEEIPAETNEDGLGIPEPVSPEALQTTERQGRHYN